MSAFPFSVYLTADRAEADGVKLTGAVLRCGTAPTLEAYLAQAQDESDTDVYPAKLRPGVDTVENGNSQVAPDEPEPTEAEIAAAELALWREQASLSRREFCLACKDAGILTFADALSAAQGNWPTAFAPALTTMTPAEAEDAQITWAAVSQIDRNDPLVAAMAAFILAVIDPLFDDAALDALFGR